MNSGQLTSEQPALSMGFRGRPRGLRKPYVSFGGDIARNNGKVPEYREMFSQDQEMYWYVERSKGALLPETL